MGNPSLYRTAMIFCVVWITLRIDMPSWRYCLASSLDNLRGGEVGEGDEVFRFMLEGWLEWGLEWTGREVCTVDDMIF